MPDFFLRMHACSIIETLGVFFLSIGMILLSGISLNSLKIILLLLVIFFVSPTVSHIISQAAKHHSSPRNNNYGDSLNSCLLCFLVITVVAIVFTNDLFNVGILTSVYSFFMTLLLFVLDAVDVAMTEAAVGAGITTVLLLGTVYLVGNKEIKPLHKPFLPIFVS